MALISLNRRPVWWCKRGAIAALWLPLTGLFFVLSALRRLAYRIGLLRSEALPVPVVVVGNLAVGGSGKTPVVIWLAERLRQRGWRPGILSRGYGGTSRLPTAVNAESDPALVGDEPVLVARRSRCPVWIGQDRAAVGRALLAAHPEVNVLITDDGLQHYRLRRQVEVVVLNEAVLGNGWLLPAGPLREPFSRLREADVLIWHGDARAERLFSLPDSSLHAMHLDAGHFYRLGNPLEQRDAADFAGLRLCAAAGIAHPERFFATLRGMGLQLQRTLAFPDHHAFAANDLALEPSEVLLLTEKDAVKCATLAQADVWVLPVEARIDDAALDHLLERLHGPETT